MTSLTTAVGGMKHWDWCPICRGGLDTGLECDQCGADLMPIYKAFKDLQARPTDSAVLRGIKARADRSRLGYGGKAWVTSDPKSEVVEDRMILIEIVCRQEFAINRLLSYVHHCEDCQTIEAYNHAGVKICDCGLEEILESLSVGNHGEPKACTPAEERGIAGATGAGQLPDGNPESTGDSADRRSPGGTERTPSPDESNRHFDRGCFVIMELMQAYERRVRSDCTPEQIEKRPWECAEYLKAAEYLRNVWPPHEPPQPAEATECRYCDEVTRIPTHRCKICGCKWILWPAGTGAHTDEWWSIATNAKCGPCCDNVAMGDQIEALPPCDNSPDLSLHDFQGWEEFDDGRGGTTVCTRCGMSAISHAMRFGP